MEPGRSNERWRDLPEAHAFVRAVRTTISVLGGKWKPLIIEVLRNEPLRFGVLLRRIPKASRKVLTDQLRDLQRAKIVSRTVLGKKSQHVEYSLSSHGRTLVPVLVVLARWGERHLKALDDENARASSGHRLITP
jgi:DNA-binding HxlR family transcriptional regulator